MDKEKYLTRYKVLGIEPIEDNELHNEWVSETFWGMTQDNWEEFQKTGKTKKMDRQIKAQQAIVDQSQSRLSRTDRAPQDIVTAILS